MTPRSLVVYAVKIAVSAGALYFLSKQIDLAAVKDHITTFWSWNLLLAEIFFLISLGLANRRWQVVLEQQGSPLPFWPLLRIGWIANFFGLFMPAGAGRDLVRAVYLSRLNIGVLGIGRSILTDRFVGLASLVLMSLPCMAWAFWAHRGLDALAWVLAAVSGGLVLGLLLLKAVVARRGLRLSSSGDGLLARVFGSASTIARDFLDPRLAGRPLALSCLVQGTMIASVYAIGARGGADAASLWTYLLFLPVIFLLLQLPITVAGLGVREAAFVMLFGAVGIKPEVSLSVSLTYFALAVANHMVGAGFYLLGDVKAAEG